LSFLQEHFLGFGYVSFLRAFIATAQQQDHRIPVFDEVDAVSGA
jgi:hypothetical protein